MVSSKGTDTKKEGDAILAALNAILNAEGWKTAAEAADPSDLKTLYENFVELKAGSANSVKSAVELLYNNVVSANGDVEKAIAAAIVGTTDNGGPFTAVKSGTSGSEVYTLSWKDNLTYPQNINLPDGAAILAYDQTQKTFGWEKNPSLGTSPTVDVKDITFPASLYYTANTGVRVNSNPSVKFPITVEGWTTGLNDWGQEVISSTRKIALNDPIQYGVAQLKTTFKCAESKLPANKIGEDNTDNTIEQYVTVPQGGFEVTGLLIGGQPKSVGYDFQPIEKDDNAFTKTVYDNNIVEGVTAAHNASEVKSNFTLLLSNNNGKATTEQKAVTIAVELKNNSDAPFRGHDGIVPKDGTFYLIGQLNPNATTGVTKPNPDVTNASVFMPAYKTEATINIKSLAKAYNVTIPSTPYFIKPPLF